MNSQEIARIRLKLKDMTPCAWKDDVAALLTAIVETNARAEVNYSLYGLTEKFHNEDLVWMESIIRAARAVVSGPDSANYTELANVLDDYEKWRRGLSQGQH